MTFPARPAAAAGTISLGDLTVNRMGFGAMRVTGAYVWGGHRDRLEMYKLLRRAFELGHTVGRALRSRRIAPIAKRLGVTPAQVVLAWLLARSPAMLPIPGMQSMAHLEENAAAAALRLSSEDLAALS